VHPVTVIGAGLAGSEAALQLARRGVDVRLVEMRPGATTPAHHSDRFAELVCSNSFKSVDRSSAAGLLKQELGMLGCELLAIAEEHAVPAGAALAVDRDAFSAAVTAALESHPSVEIVREEATSFPGEGVVIVATGPLTSTGLEGTLSRIVGEDRLAFYDAAAPIVEASSVDTTIAFAASRYDKGGGRDYLNCPLDAPQYLRLRSDLVSAARVKAKEFETSDLFQACMPVEELARKGEDALRFGPLKPVGLTDPRTGRQPYAVVQLRAENAAATAFNLVGFQTNLTFAEQKRVFRAIPGLEAARFLRFGVMHRNTFVDAPRVLAPDLSAREAPHVFLAGQLTGTEGYVEAIASGLFASLNVYARLVGGEPVVLPETTALGSLLAYATDPETTPYQPMHVNFGLVPPLDPPVSGKRRRYAAYADRAIEDLHGYLATRPDLEVRSRPPRGADDA
jgi:methylenetetrahydrofolate--tRNA-(uracil-5-)-methyltransferase